VSFVPFVVISPGTRPDAPGVFTGG